MTDRRRQRLLVGAGMALAAGALLLGAVASSWLMVLVGGGWKQGVPGHVAWACMPYAVLLIVFISLNRARVHPPVRRFLVWKVVLVSLGGPLLYVDAMFVHVDAQGAMAVLMVPVMQTAISLFGIVTAILWQRHIRRSATRAHRQTDGGGASARSTLWGVRGLKRVIRAMLASAILVTASIYSLISILQRSDSKSMEIAREIDGFVGQYCKLNKILPTLEVLRARFPDLTTDTGWFFFTNDRTYLKVQYPMQWWNGDAVGYPQISEFTATPYAYSVDYQCKASQ